MSDINVSGTDTSGLPDTIRVALEAAGQAMFEYDGTALTWADTSGASAVLGASAANGYDAFTTALSPEDALAREAAVQSARSAGTSYTVEYALVGGAPGAAWAEERGTWLQFGDTAKLIGVVRRIDDQKRREARLSYLASYDDLTGALNRARCKEALKDALTGAHDGVPAAYLLVGIDDLGKLNADFGFDVADQVIIAVAERLSCAVRGHGVYGRVAGTKFGVVLRGDDAQVRKICTAILTAMRESVVPTSAGGIGMSVCVGAATLCTGVQSADNAMAMAEAALDGARQQGPSSWSTFSEKTDLQTTRRRNTEMSDVILTALNDRRVLLAYQPIVTDVDAPHEKFECLIRMHDGEGGLIPAPAFIPAAEKLGLVHLLDRRVLELATTALNRKPDVSLAVNISWETVKDPLWAEGYLSHLRANRHLADRITVELTETQLVDAIEASAEFVSEIKSLGCRFAIDDFGAGYTSFRNLKALDIDVLKIDGSFVSGLCESRENQLFVRTLLDLARNFEMQTVAEWVDNPADATLLKALGVDFLQGFHIGKPEPRPNWTERQWGAETPVSAHA